MNPSPLVIKPENYSPNFLRAISFILPHETEFQRGHFNDWTESSVRTENVAGDSGGVTRYGIDKSSHPGIDVAKLTQDDAVKIYWTEWLRHRLDLLPDRLAIAAFDVYVNGGYPIRWLQHAYNTTHQEVKLLVEDNQLGPITIATLGKANQDALLRIFLTERDERFRNLAVNPTRAKFLDGWLARDTDLERFLNVYYPPTSGQRASLVATIAVILLGSFALSSCADYQKTVASRSIEGYAKGDPSTGAGRIGEQYTVTYR